MSRNRRFDDCNIVSLYPPSLLFRRTDIFSFLEAFLHHVVIFCCLLSLTLVLALVSCGHAEKGSAALEYVVPDIVHQTYNYQSPSYFLYLSVLSTNHFLMPKRHIIWVNGAGKHRAHWDSWQAQSVEGSWEKNFTNMFTDGRVEANFVTFRVFPPGNNSTYFNNKAHHSDFLRLRILSEMGGIYVDTDVFACQSFDELRQHDFTMGFDNVVPLARDYIANPDPKASDTLHRFNNGIMLAKPNASFLKIWANEYHNFDPVAYSTILPSSPFV